MSSIDDRYKEWKKKKNARSEGESTDSSSQTASVDDRYKAWRAQRLDLEGIANSIADRTSTWLKNHNNYLSNYNNRFSGRKGTYEDSYVADSGDWLSTVSQQRDNFEKEANSILSMLDKYGDYLDPKWTSSIRDALTSAGAQQADILKYATGDSDYWSQFASKDEYGLWQTDQGYRSKYSGQSYEDIMASIGQLEDGEEKQWLSSNKYDLLGTAADFGDRSASGWEKYLTDDEARKQREQGQDKSETFWEKLGRWLGTTPDTSLPMGTTSQVINDLRNDTSYQRPSSNWTEEQKSMYGYLYDADKNAAAQYAQMTNEANAQAENQEKIAAIENWATKNGWTGAASTIGAIAMMPLSLADTLSALTEYNARGFVSTPSTPLPGQVSQAITGAIATTLNENGGTLNEKIPVIGGKGWGDAYQLGTSIAQSMISGYTQGGLGTYMVFFGSASSSAMYDAKNRGASDEQAITLGILSGLAEAAGEAFSVEHLLSNGSVSELSGFFSNVLLQAGIEASEEGVTTLLNNFSDQLVMGDKSNFNILVQQYMSEGMSEEDAKKKAWKSMANDLVFDMLGGAISGGVSSGLQTGVQTMFANHDAKQTYGNYAGELVGEALEIDPSNTFAQKMQGRLDSGKKLSGGQLNRLVQQNERTLTAQDLSSIQSAATQRLTELGETGDVDAVAAALTKRFSGQKLTHKESQLIQNSQYGRRVSTEMNPENIRNGGYSSEWAENIGTERINAQEYSRMLEAAQQAQETAETTGGQVVTETQNEAQAAKTEPSNVVHAENAVTTKSVSKDGVTRQVSTGKEVTPKKIVSISGGKVMIETDSGTVSADDIEFDTMENDLLWRSAVQFNGITASSANGIVRAYRNGESVTSYLAGAGQEFRNGYYNLPSGGEMANKLTSAQREIIYELGQKAAGENIAKAQAKATADKKSSATVSKTEKVGKVHFERNGRTFDGVRETALKTMEQLSAALGVEFYVFESYKNEAGKLVYKDANGNEVPAPNGYYDPKDGSIHIDLNAGVDGKGTMLFTVAHELTHFINQWSPAKFKVLANVLMKQYAEKNVSVDDLVNNQIKKAKKNGRELTWDEAYEEVVADSMEAMLTDGNVVQLMADLKQQDKTLWQKICDWFKDLVADLKAVVDAYKGYKPDSSEGRMVAQMQDVIVMLESFYADALLDAGENYQAAAEAQKNTTQEGDVKMSIRDDFYSEVDSWDGKSKRTFVVGRTSDVLKNIGAKDSRIIWHGEKMARIMREHSGMDKTVIKQVPQILENPVIILASKQSDSRLVIFGTVTDTNGTPVTAILELQPTNKGGQILDMQVIASAYGKDNTKNLVESSGLVYIDPNKQRTKIWMQGVGLQLPSDATNLGSVGSITYPDGKVKIESVPYSQYMQGGGNKFSVREIVPISNDDIKKAEQFFGTTTNYSVAGYLLTDGRMLDFSGKHWGDTFSTSRQVDHRDIWDAWENGDKDGFAEMVNMIGNGNIRLMPESGGINLAIMPNATQITTLRGYINHFRGEVIVDVDKVGGDTIHSFEYSRGTSSSKILSDIKEYFENGTVPKKQSSIRDFLYSDRDSDGNQLSTEQQEYFKDSQVRDEQGRLLAMYHGTPNGGFTKFRSGTYFTQNAAYADVYQSPGASYISTKKGADAPMTYKVYLDIKKPFDTRNAKERKIFEQEFYRKYGTGTPLADSGLPDWVDGMDLQEFIEEMEYDYDGLILDEGGVGGYGDEVVSRGLSYVVFDPAQVKDVGNKTPTDDPDYRYSDRDYMDAVNRGDMETAQNMVDEAAVAAGYTTKGYHGSRTPGFTVVDKYSTLWLARDEFVANGYGVSTTVDAAGKPHNEKGVYAMRYNLGNNLEIHADGASWGELPVTQDEYPGVYADEETGDITTNAMAGWAEENGYDSITFVDVDDGGLTTVDVIFNPNRDAKSVDTVTYDDSGNVIPLSKRFDKDNDDIRYSARDSDGDALTAEQNAFFAKSKARDKDGKLLVLYHGTANAGFTAFDPSKGRLGGSWFTTSKQDADSYAGNYRGKLFDPNERDNIRSGVGGNYTLGSWMRFDSEADRAEFIKQYPNAESIKTDAEYAELMQQASNARDWDEFDRLEEEQHDRRNELRKIQKAYGRYEWEHSREATLQELFDNPEQFSMSDVLRAWDAYDSNNSVDQDDATKEDLIEALREADRESIEQGDDTISDIRFKARLPVGQSGDIVNRANNRTYAVYANTIKPYEIDAGHRTLHEADLYPVIEAGLKDTAYDSVIVRNAKVGAHEGIGDVVIIKKAGQVKLTSNKTPTEGTDIHFSERDPELEKVNRVLEKENAQLKHDVAYLKELLKLQNQVTGGTKFTKTSVEAAAGQLMKHADAKGDRKELAGLLNGLYEYIAGSKEPTWDGVVEAAQPAVEWLKSHVRTRTERSAYAKDVLKEIQNSRIYLDEQQKKEVAYQYGSYNEFRKKTMGSVILTDTATMSLDSQWHEWAAKYPNLFDPDITSTNMPAALMEVFDSLRNMSATDSYGYDQELLGQELLSRVYDSYWNVSTLYTVKDKAQKEINKLKFEHAGRMATLREYHKEQTTKLKTEHREALQKVKQAERERSEKKLQEISERYQESRQKGIENRRKTEMRRKIRRTIMDLNKILNRGDKKRNVKEDMKDLVSKALKTADILFTDNYMAEDMIRNGVGTELTEQEAKYLTEAQSILAEIEGAGTLQDRQEAENRLQGKLDYRMSKLKDVFAREKARLNKTKVSEVLGDLADAYASLEDSEYSYVSGAFDENVHQYLTMLKADVGGTIVKDMSLNQLDELHKAYTMVLTTVRNANKMFAANLKQTREQLGSQVIGEVKQAGGEHGLWLPGEDKLNAFSWNNQKPVYAFERIGSATLTKLFENTRAGEDSWAQDMTEAREYYLAQTKKHHYDSWNFEKQFKFTSTSGIDFSLNLEQIMSLYAYSKREQAHDHLLKGGFVFDGNTEVQVNKMGIKVTYLNKTAKAHNISPEIMGQIISKLTAEQKAFVDEMQDYLSTTMGEKGNEVSMQMYGVKLFNEKYYFPLRSAGQYMARAKEADLKKQQGQISIVNSGFTKSTTPKSSNPVVLSGFMDVWADHVNEMSMYHSFVLPMEDFRRVYNYSSPNMETGQSVSVNSVIQEAYGEAATGYIDQLYRDLNGGAVSDPRENGIKALVGKFKKAAVFASLSVVIQQPSAIGRAFAIIDPRYFIGSKVDNKRHKALWAELKKYAPVAVIKEMGYFDTGMGKSAQDFIKGKEYNTLKEKAAALFTDKDYRDEVLSKAPALADELTWCAIWEAAKRETKANNPKMDVKSEEFLQLAGKRFTEVITKTQVYDSVLSRSANMRSKGVFMSMWTAFMAEPTTSINMLEDALRKAKRGNKKYAAKAIGAVTTSVVLNSLLSSLVYAMRDDDDDETFLEKYVQSFATEILDGINPLTYYPFLKDIWSSLQGFDIERSDMSLITSLVEKVTKLVQVYAKDAEDRNDGDLANAWWGVADYVAAIAGVPVKNVRRDINGAINTYKTVSQDLTDRDTTWGSLVDKTWDSVKNSLPVVGWLPDETAADKLYKATVSGDTVYQKRLSSAYDTQEKLDNAIRKGLRANDSRIWEAAMAWNNNDLASYMRIAKEIIGEGHFSQDNVVMAIQAEAKAMLPNDSDSTEKAKGYFTADKFAVAISQGNDTMAATIKADIIETAQKNGKTAEEAEDSFTSSAKSSIKKLFQKGGMTGTQAAKALVDYFGISEEDAAEDVQYWTFQNKYPEYDMSESAVTRYYEYAEPAGIDVSVYYDYYTQASKCESDLDKNGNAISGSKKAKILDVIDSMELTKAQKDALYYANGWAKSTIYEAPWR